MDSILVMGSKRIGLEILRSVCLSNHNQRILSLTVDDRSDSRSCYDEWISYARNQGLTCYSVAHGREAVPHILAIRPRIVVLAGWYWLISESVLESVPLGFLGVHFSLLPKYRGFSPLVWSLLNGERKVGISLFSLSAGMDEGAIWGQREIVVPPDPYIGDVLPLVESAAVQLVIEKMPGILAGAAQPRLQSHAGATYCPRRSPDDGHIDWTRPGEEINRFIRAQSLPYPGAFSFLDGQPLTIWRSTLQLNKGEGEAGTIVTLNGDGATVVCGDRRLLLVEQVQPRTAASVEKFGELLKPGRRFV